MDRLRRFGWWVWENLDKVLTLGGYAMSFAGTAYAAKTANIMAQYAPFSWVAAGFLGLIAAALIYAIAGFARNIWVTASVRNRFYRQSDRINPMDAIFQRQRISLSDLVNPLEPIVRGKKFLDCEIMGPGNIVPMVNTIGPGKFIGNTFAAFDVFELAEGAVPKNAIVFVDCDFESCRFYKVNLLFQKQFSEMADALINGLHWVTERPTQPLPPLIDQNEGEPSHG